MSILASIRQNAMGLGLFAVLTAGVIAITQLVTAPRISENERQYQAKLLFDILPLADETMLNTPRSLAQFSDVALLGTDQDAEYFMDADTATSYCRWSHQMVTQKAFACWLAYPVTAQ